MAEKRTEAPSKPPKSAPSLTPFPSAAFWEDPWEPHFNLHALREKASNLDAIGRLANKLQPGIELPGPSRDELARLVIPLGLEERKAEILLEDSSLLARWYSLAKVAQRIRIGRDVLIDTLRQAGQYADSLQLLLGGIARETEELAEDLTVELPMVTENRSLMSLADDVGQFGLAARTIVKLLRPQARPKERRRNLAIMLACQAVEEATGQRVTTGRRNPDATGECFKNAPGRFIAGLMKLLARSSEEVVAGAFIELRRAGSKQHSRR